MDSQYAIIVAGGSGARMNNDDPKQFIEVAGLPVLMHTIKAFYKYDKDLKIVTVLPENDIGYWEELCQKYKFEIKTEVQKGGKTRFGSVQNGLELIGDTGVVAIHDGVRPVIDSEIIAASFSIASIHGSAIASVRLKESLRVIDKDRTRTVDRSNFRLIQTPQTFQIPIIKEAYAMAEDKDFTDDASVVEDAGYKISLFEGSYRNIKITTPEDLEVVNALIMNRK
ncbi:2-C-methyl-D-erythritol 4-phosphate cytidylyltransferase [Bacteroidota bacterium]